jgi:hypothetical protein
VRTDGPPAGREAGSTGPEGAGGRGDVLGPSSPAARLGCEVEPRGRGVVVGDLHASRVDAVGEGLARWSPRAGGGRASVPGREVARGDRRKEWLVFGRRTALNCARNSGLRPRVPARTVPCAQRMSGRVERPDQADLCAGRGRQPESLGAPVPQPRRRACMDPREKGLGRCRSPGFASWATGRDPGEGRVETRLPARAFLRRRRRRGCVCPRGAARDGSVGGASRLLRSTSGDGVYGERVIANVAQQASGAAIGRDRGVAEGVAGCQRASGLMRSSGHALRALPTRSPPLTPSEADSWWCAR